MKNSWKAALISLMIGGFVIYWAEAHSPKKLGGVIGNFFSGSYTMSETEYNISIGLGALFCVFGVWKLMRK